MKTEVMRVLLTGGSRGIGSAISREMHELGWEVEAPTRSDLDLSNPSSVEEFIQNAGSHPSFQGLILNAGINHPSVISQLSFPDVDRILEVNLKSSIRLISAFVPRMADKQFGRVVAITSAYAQRVRTGRSAYAASKAGLEALIRSTAVEYATAGVLANSVAPGFVETDLTRVNNSDREIAEIVSRIPIGRLARVDEVGTLVAYLMSQRNTYITGQSISIDGGFSCT